MHGRSPLLRLQSDERLVALMRRGNHAAFEHLVGRYQTRLLAFCRHMLVSMEDAEDVLQDVFAAAFNAILADDRPINVRPWLYRIARNRSLNHLRRASAVGVDSMDVHFSDHGETTADQVHKREEFRLLVGDIRDLPETQRTALLLREMEALSYEQIAEAMETTIPGVKSLLVRARVSLAEAAEARQLTCAEVRLELGEVAEGLRRRTSAPVRRHLRSCERCSTFRGQLKETNRALAALLPIGPLVVLRKLAFFHFLGHGAGAGAGAGSHATAAGSTAAAGGGAAAAAGGGAAGGAAAAGGGAAAGGAAAGGAAAGGAAAGGAAAGGAAAGGAAAGGAAAGGAAAAGSTVAAAAAGSTATGLISAGVGAVATKAAAGLAAAAIVTAGAVEVDQTGRHSQQLQGSPLSAAIVTPAAGSAKVGTPRASHRLPLKSTAAKHAKDTATSTTTTTAAAATTATTPLVPASAQGRTETTTVSTTLPSSGADGVTSPSGTGEVITTPSLTSTTPVPTPTSGSCTASAAPAPAPTAGTTTTGTTPTGTTTVPVPTTPAPTAAAPPPPVCSATAPAPSAPSSAGSAGG
jgi:RNA polymerase sigma factor (sigma-70 family)